MSALRCAALIVGLALAVGVAVAAGGGPRVAAHRGGALLWPENSLLAYGQALALGVDLLETDVHLTADDEVIVLHDPTLERTTTGRGVVRERRLADLAALRLKGADGAATAESIPTLAALLDLLKPHRAGLLVEIKVGPGRARYPGIEEKVLALVHGRGLADRTVIMAFEPATIVRVRELAAPIRTALLVGRGRVDRERAGSADILRWAREASATDLGVDHRVLGPELATAARGAGIGLAAWTVNEDVDLRRMIALGVGTVITDRPDLALRLLGRRACAPPGHGR